MRLDRLITLGIVLPLRRALAAGSKARALPILMYHSVSDTVETHRAAYFQVCTSPGQFRGQMEYLRRNQWQGVTLAEGIRRMNAGEDLARTVVITFDDGFRDFYSAAFPILRDLGFNATMYLPTAYIGDHPRQFLGHECMVWSEVRELHRTGVEFGSHTVNHPRLIELPAYEVERELRDSKDVLEQQLGARVTSFAYPFAFPAADHGFVSTLERLLLGLGYENSVTTTIGRLQPRAGSFGIPRLPMNTADDDALLGAKLAGAYDWVRELQYLRKRAVRRTSTRSF